MTAPQKSRHTLIDCALSKVVRNKVRHMQPQQSFCTPQVTYVCPGCDNIQVVCLSE